jgi:hypothetical protein
MTTPTLSEVLKRIFDTEWVRRDEWASALGVSTAAISQWVNGRTVPGPDHLEAMGVLVAQDDRLPMELSDQFEGLLDRPTGEVLHSSRRSMEPTLRHYLVRPRREAAMKLLATLPPTEQLYVLDDLGERVRHRLQHPEPPTPLLKFPDPRGSLDRARLDKITMEAQKRKLVLPMYG